MRGGFRYEQYEEHPVAFNTQSSQEENANTQPQRQYESYPPLGLLNKNPDDKNWKWVVQQRFNSIGSDGGLRKFQKATNSLRRNNMESKVKVVQSQQYVCIVPNKNDNMQNMRRRADTPLFDDINIDEVDSEFVRKIRKLVWTSILHKYKQALDEVFDPDTNPGKNNFVVNDDKSDSNNFSYESEDTGEEEHNKGNEPMTKKSKA